MFQLVLAGDVGDPTDFLAIGAIVVFAAILALVGLYLHHRRETRTRQKREQEFDEILVKQAVSAGRLAAEKATENKTPKKRRRKRRPTKSKPRSR
jgi:hypothetical protein